LGRGLYNLRRGTLVVSHYTNCFPFIKSYLEALGYDHVDTTDKERDALNMLINDVKPKIVLIDSFFCSGATPYMVSRLVKSFRRIKFSVFSIGMYPDDRAAWFILSGAKSYVKLSDGIEEFKEGLKCICEGKQYIASDVQHIMDALDEVPDIVGDVEEKQRDVLLLMCNGKRPLEIAKKLHVCKRTVDYHIKKLLKIFHVHKNDALIGLAMYLDIVTKNDLCFFDEIAKKITLPKWAVVQQKINRIANEVISK
jgi:DNA-binding NarL/FixJ family response regulator